MLYEYQTRPMLEHLHNGEIDVGILALPVHAEGIETRALYDEPFMLALPENHALARRKEARAADLDGQTLLLLEDGHCLRDQALAVCHNTTAHEKQDFRATSIETLRQMVAAGVGLTLLPALATRGAYAAASGLAVRPFAKPAPVRHIGAAWRSRSARAPAIRAILDLIVRHSGLRMTAEAPANLTAYDRLHWSATELETLLATGQHRRELLAYFGHADYERLAGLARHAAARPRRGTPPRVYVIPGILGSELGVVRPEPWPADLIWVDAIDIINGRLTELGLAAGTRIVPLGVLPPTYAPLQLELRAGGCDVVMHAYDWRRSVLETGRELAARLDADPAPEIHIIAHSMGGLVARAALRAAANARVVRLITVATPHAGSFAPLQALRGTYPVVRRLAALDRRHDAGQLAGEVFRGFPSLYEMLPTAAAGCGIDLFDARQLAARRTSSRRRAAARGARTAGRARARR